jgi:hypothetical protein
MIYIILNLIQYLYVPGKLSNVNKVIVDVGTGYYVEKVSRDMKKRGLESMLMQILSSLLEMHPSFTMTKLVMLKRTLLHLKRPLQTSKAH